MNDEAAIQREYYRQTADKFDQLHCGAGTEHDLAVALLGGMLRHLHVESVLDLGSGTGRALVALKSMAPGLKVTGVEPVAELREVGYAKGLAREELIDGDALNLKFPDGAFDLVSEFGVLHHVRFPEKMVAEMLRVAKKAVFISDGNNFGQGSRLGRLAKRCLKSIGAWKLAKWLQTGGKGYTLTEGDGLAYSYSIFDNYDLIRAQCRQVHLFNTSSLPTGEFDLYKAAGHLVLVGVK